MILLGADPSIATCGLVVIRWPGPTVLAAETVRTKTKDPEEIRLVQIARAVLRLATRHSARIAAVEREGSWTREKRNVSGLQLLAAARGAVIVASAYAGAEPRLVHVAEWKGKKSDKTVRFEVEAVIAPRWPDVRQASQHVVDALGVAMYAARAEVVRAAIEGETASPVDGDAKGARSW